MDRLPQEIIDSIAAHLPSKSAELPEAKNPRKLYGKLIVEVASLAIEVTPQ